MPSPPSSASAAGCTPSIPAVAASRTCSWAWSATTGRRPTRSRPPGRAGMTPRPSSSSPRSPCARSCAGGSGSCSPSSIVSVVLVGWGVERLVTLAREGDVSEIEIRIGVSQVLILIAFMFSFVLAMSAAFLGRAGDRVGRRDRHRARDAGPADASQRPRDRPLARACRSWSAAMRPLSGLLAMAVVDLVSGHMPPEPLVAVAFLAFQAVTVLTLALALGTRLPAIAAGAVTVVLFGVGWFVGVLGSVAIAVRGGAAGPCGRRDARDHADRRPVARRRLRPRAAARAALAAGRDPEGWPPTRSSRARRRPSRSSPGASSGSVLVLRAGHRPVPAPRAVTAALAPAT